MNTAPRHQTVRLGFLWRAAGAPIGCVLALAMGVVLADSGDAGRMGAVPALLLSSAAVLGVALPVPYGFWLRADDHGLTLVRAFVPRRYRWRDIQGLTMDAGQDADSGAHRLVLLLRLTSAPRRTARGARDAHLNGPVLGILGTTRDGLPRGTEPRRLAELFDLLRRHGVPLDDRRYADLVLTAHGYPALAHTAPGASLSARPAARPDAA
ncbi:PH domain-containing protein [Kitasatospora sp. NPDC098663]|uniref:PH domain-containing protein n=1 Tax=Kitasatospora sp. NPDC098663 TaxID=3364096 RepID=UPI00382F9FAF